MTSLGEKLTNNNLIRIRKIPNRDNLKTLYLNCRSLGNKRTRLKNLVKILSDYTIDETKNNSLWALENKNFVKFRPDRNKE